MKPPSAHVEATEPAVSALGVKRALGGRAVLRGTDLTLRAGEVTALLGASGGGKTTLARLIAGLDRLDEGRIYVRGRLASGPSVHAPPETRAVGVVFQDFALFPHLTAIENVAFGLRAPSPAVRLAGAADWLEAVGLAHRAAAYAHELSGGEQQRVALARALAPKPAAVLLDEPFSNLDDLMRRGLAERAADLIRGSGAAGLLITHHAEEAMATCDALALMIDGVIAQVGPPQGVYARPVNAVAARLTGDVNVWSGRVGSGALATPLGALAAAGLADGTRCDALIRPEAIALRPGAQGRVTRARRVGPASLIEFVIHSAPDHVWRARLSSLIDFEVGAGIDVDLEARLCATAAATSA